MKKYLWRIKKTVPNKISLVVPITALFVSFLFINTYAQGNGKYLVSGNVKDQNNHHVSFATILLQNSSDSTFVKGEVTDTLGNFSFLNLAEDKYLLTVSIIGFEKYSTIINVAKDLILNINLKKTNIILDEVIVKSNKPIIEQKIDRLIFNVQNSIIASTGNAWNSLDKTPGVRVDFNDNISVNNLGVRILINDRPLKLTGKDASNYLKSISAKSIQRIEVITNPPAKYGAEGGALLNIVLKKDLNLGWNYFIQGEYIQSQYGKYNSGISINHRSKKINFYTNYNFSDGEYLTETESFVLYNNDAVLSDWQLNEVNLSNRYSHSYRLGVDYDINANHVVGFLANGFNSNKKSNSNVETTISDIFENTDSTLYTNGNNNTDTRLYSFNINYKGVLDTLGKKLEIDFDFATYNTDPFQETDTDVFIENQKERNILFNNSSTQKINIKSVTIDYSSKLGGVSMNMGGKFSGIKTDNQQFFQNFAGGGESMNRSNEFIYTENTQAAYISFLKGFKKMGMSLGLRAENTQTISNSVSLNEKFKNNYLQIFPTLYIQYNINKKNQANFSFGRRINRPDYWRLNPFENFVTPYYSLLGNPTLRPANPNTFQISYIHNRRYHFNIFYYDTKDRFTNIAQQINEAQIYRDIQLNLDNSQTIGISTFIPIRIKDFWDIRTYLQISHDTEKSNYLEGQFNFKRWNLYSSINNSIFISKKKNISGELSFWYSTPKFQGIYNFSNQYELNAGVRFSILKGNGDITINFSDIFYSNTYRADVEYLDQRNGFFEQRDSRSVKVNFSYRFGNHKVKQPRKRKDNSEDDQNRLRKQ